VWVVSDARGHTCNHLVNRPDIVSQARALSVQVYAQLLQLFIVLRQLLCNVVAQTLPSGCALAHLIHRVQFNILHCTIHRLSYWTILATLLIHF
jgi:hypothetical protein